MVSYIFFHLFPSAEMSVYPQAGPSGAFVFGPAAASPVSAIPNASKLTSHCNINMLAMSILFPVSLSNHLYVFGPLVAPAHG